MEYKTPRDLEDIIIEIVKNIPNTEYKLTNEINKLQSDLCYRATEVRRGGYYWAKFINILNRHIPDIKEEWQIKIRDILNDKR